MILSFELCKCLSLNSIGLYYVKMISKLNGWVRFMEMLEDVYGVWRGHGPRFCYRSCVGEKEFESLNLKLKTTLRTYYSGKLRLAVQPTIEKSQVLSGAELGTT